MGLKTLSKRNLKNAKNLISGIEFYGVNEDDISNIAKIKFLELKIAELEKQIDILIKHNNKENQSEIDEQLKQFFNPIEGFK